MSVVRPAVFLDKDGTLVDDVPYNADPARIRLAPDCAAGLRSLSEAGYELLVISNQSGVARGYFPEAALAGVDARLRELLAELGVRLAGCYFCPHHPQGKVRAYARQCLCRKPRPGLVLHAARVHRLDLARSWFIGDILDDMEAGRRAGCGTILIDNGHETEWVLNAGRRPHHLAGSINEAARIILSPDGRADTGQAVWGRKRMGVGI